MRKMRNEKSSRNICAVPVKVFTTPDVSVTVAAWLACLCGLVLAYLADDAAAHHEQSGGTGEEMNRKFKCVQFDVQISVITPRRGSLRIAQGRA